MHKLPTLLAALALATTTQPGRADEISLTTAIPTGQTMQLALNADVKATLTWGNGDTQTYTGDGTIQTLEVKDANLTITTTQGRIKALWANSQSLTALNLSGAPYLKTLIAADNQLTSIALTQNTELETVNLQQNALTSISLSAAPNLTDLNIAGNNISGAAPTLNSSARLIYYVASDNNFSAAPGTNPLSQSKTVWIDGNNIGSITVGTKGQLHTLNLNNNKLKRLNLVNQSQLTDLSIAGNTLSTLSLSNGAAKLEYLDAENNSLNTITWDEVRNRPTAYVYLSGNNLFPNSLPTPTKLTDFIYTNQGEYPLSATAYDLNEKVDLSDILYKNGYGTTISTRSTYTLTDSNGQTLEKGTDYKLSGRTFTFLTSHPGVRLSVDNTYYPDITFQTSTFDVGDVTAIHLVKQADALSLTPGKGHITIHTTDATPLQIFDLQGKPIVNTPAHSGTHTYHVSPGIYLVNGQKVVVR